MRIHIDETRCQGFGLCKLAAPDFFDVGDRDGYAIALVDRVPPGREDEAAAAARQCPMAAIALID